VEFATVEEAQRAIDELNEKELMGRNVFVREDRENKPLRRQREPREQRSDRNTTGRQLFIGNVAFY
jgi:RNA recognition motif-containing protein